MKRIYQFTFSVLTITSLLGGWFLFNYRPGAANNAYFASLYNGRAQIEGPVQLEMWLTPTISQVGDILTLQLNLFNTSPDIVGPEITIQLPEALEIDLTQRVTGIVFTPQNNQFSWQPIAGANGGVAQMGIPLTVKSVNPDNPEQIIQATLKYNNQQYQAQLVLWAGVAPEGKPIINPGRASVGQPIQLQAQTAGSGPFSQIWQTGDGRTITANDPTVMYPLIGTYKVDLQLSNPLSTHNSEEYVVIVPEPASFFTASDTTPQINQPVQFTSLSGGQPPITYLWEFGDGTFSEEINPAHAYGVVGQYTVQLTVRNDYGQAQNYLTINVGEAPIADADVPAEGFSGRPLTSQAFTDETARIIRWDMGDGQTYEGAVVNHTYRKTGNYLVTMIAGNEFGETIVTSWVTVNKGDTFVYLPVVYADGQILPFDAAFLENQLIPTTGSGVVVTASTIQFVDNKKEIVLQALSDIDTLPPNQQLLWYINDARRQAGLNPVNLITELSTAAKQHTNDMAGKGFTSHTGSDGSPPYERVARVGYRNGGYAGETTAWGFRYGREAVQFWLESPPHRAILLNPIATDVGVAQTTNYNAPSVWYWTAEFGSTYGSIENQMLQAGIRPTGPYTGTEVIFGQTVPFQWSWPLPVPQDHRFVVRLQSDLGFNQVVGTTNLPLELESLVGTPQEGRLYWLGRLPEEMTQKAGTYQWRVELEDNTGRMLTKSEWLTLVITGTLPTATPTATLIPTVYPTSTPLATPWPTATMKPTQAVPTPTLIPILTQPKMTMTPSGTQTPAVTLTPSITPTPSATSTPTITPTPGPTDTPQPSPTSTIPIGIEPTNTPTP